MIALLGHALLTAPANTWRHVTRTLLLTLVPLAGLAVALRFSAAPILEDALPGVLLFGLGVTYAALGILQARHLFAWTGVMLVGLAFAELAAAVPALASSLSPLNVLCPVALLLGGLGGYRDVQQVFAARRQRMLASRATGLTAQVMARDLRTAQEERAHEASSELLAIEGATGTLERCRDLLDGDTRQALAGALQAEIGRLRALLDQAPIAARPASFSVAGALDPVVICANASGMRVRCAVAADLRAWGSAAHLTRVVQQSLLNADRHAPGSGVRITAERDGGSVLVRVADGGQAWRGTCVSGSSSAALPLPKPAVAVWAWASPANWSTTRAASLGMRTAPTAAPAAPCAFPLTGSCRHEAGDGPDRLRLRRRPLSRDCARGPARPTRAGSADRPPRPACRPTCTHLQP